MDLIADKKRSNRFSILTKHIGTNVDVFCLGLRFKKTLCQAIEPQNVLQKYQPSRTRLYGNEGDRYGGGVSPEDGEQLFKGLENFLRRRPVGEIIVACVNDNCRRLSRDNESVGVSNAIGQSRPAKSAIQHGVPGKILLERFPEPDG
jgi:hypothetical protein